MRIYMLAGRRDLVFPFMMLGVSSQHLGDTQETVSKALYPGLVGSLKAMEIGD